MNRYEAPSLEVKVIVADEVMTASTIVDVDINAGDLD